MPELFYDPAFLAHDTGEHPESAARLEAVLAGLRESHAFPAAGPRACPEIEMDALLRVHEPSYVDLVRRTAEAGGGFLDPDTVVSRESYGAAMRAAGAAVSAVEGAVSGEFESAFCAVRPPGHHALPGRGMGFCLFNNVAIAAVHARAALGVGRVLIVDWDAHHGNGTQDFFAEDPDVFYLSLHRFPYYPGTGSPGERGRGAGEGATLNVPLRAGTGHDDFLAAFETALAAAAAFRPELVLVSSGFDAARGDALGGLDLLPETFASATGLLAGLADGCGHAPIVSVLEGGYDVRGLGECARAHFENLP